MKSVHLAWGAKVSRELSLRVIQTGTDFGFDPNWLMACIAFETGRTFSPSVRNPGSSATGLIQFMRATATALGTTVEALAGMTAEKQFDYVWLYLRDVIKVRGAPKSLADCYMMILYPKAVGWDASAVLWVAGNSAYAVNAGLDANRDHVITKAEAAARVGAMLLEGMGPLNAADIELQQKEKKMSIISSAFRFVFSHAFAAAARAAATADPNAVKVGIEVVKATPMPVDGSPNSPAGSASDLIRKLENNLNNLVAVFVEEAIESLPVVGALANATGLDKKAADAAKVLLVLAEQHALTYMSALFSAHHLAVSSVTVKEEPIT